MVDNYHYILNPLILIVLFDSIVLKKLMGLFLCFLVKEQFQKLQQRIKRQLLAKKEQKHFDLRL